MRHTSRFLLCAALAAPCFAASVQPFDSGWRFLKADAPAAETLEFDDSIWRTVSLPHDWAIEGPFDEKNPSGQGGGYLPGGVGWYRKRFTLPAGNPDRRVFIDFDGVMANSDVWINGFHLGKHPNGYVSFRYELTGHLYAAGKDNVLAVRADNSQQPASRWYPGAGIYRHVRLVTSDPVHLAHWSTFVTTPKTTLVHVAGIVENQSDAVRSVALEIALLAPNGVTVAKATTPAQDIREGEQATFAQDLPVATPELWNLDHPALYRAVVRVTNGQNALDEESVPFGIREYHFDPTTGFWLNGRNFKIKGVCLHNDAGGLGAAVPLAAWERRLATLRTLGVNAIRTAHNPPAPEFLDLADRMGFLVMDEMFDCWTVAKNPFDYHLYFREWSKIDTRDTVMRDRNHPSIILYSAGNEIHDTPNAALAKDILSGLVAVFHANDPTRPVTQALFRPNVSHDYEDGLADLLDVVGQNYRENEILAAHEQKPTRKIIGTENQMGRQVWTALRDNAPYAGQFLWVGIDDLGEAGRWPSIASSQGLLDHTGSASSPWASSVKAGGRKNRLSTSFAASCPRGALRPTPAMRARNAARRRRFLPTGRPPTSPPTRKTWKSTATVPRLSSPSTTNPSARSPFLRTPRRACGASHSSPAPSRRHARTGPGTSFAPRERPRRSRSPSTGRSCATIGTTSPPSPRRSPTLPA